MVCFDLGDSKMNIIDHTLAETHGTFGEKYGDTPSILVIYITHYILYIIHHKLYIMFNCSIFFWFWRVEKILCNITYEVQGFKNGGTGQKM